MIYVGEWLTLDQAARVLGITRADLRPLHESGDLEVVQLYPGGWRVKNDDVQELAATPEWKAR